VELSIKFNCIIESTIFTPLFEVCRDTKQRQSHGDTSITIIFFTVVKNIDKQWNISLFHCKAWKKGCYLPIFIYFSCLLVSDPFYASVTMYPSFPYYWQSPVNKWQYVLCLPVALTAYWWHHWFSHRTQKTRVNTGGVGTIAPDVRTFTRLSNLFAFYWTHVYIWSN